MRVVILGGGGGVGWANNVHCCAFSYTSAHTSCYVAVRSPTLLMVWGGVGGGMLTFLALRTLHVATL